MNEQQEREAFEAWCKSIGFTTARNYEGDYLIGYGSELWSGWQARASLATHNNDLGQVDDIDVVESEREAFEAWAKNRAHPFHDREPLLNGAIDRYSDIAWAAWQARAALAANEKVPSRATDIATALSLPGCERLREWAEIGPVQRAAVEEFAYALAAKVPADYKLVPIEPTEAILRALTDPFIAINGDNRKAFANAWAAMLAAAPAPEATAKNEWRELALKFDGQRMAALSHLRMLLEHGEAHAEAVRTFLAEPPRAAPTPEAVPTGLAAQFFAGAQAAGIKTIHELPGLIPALQATEPAQAQRGAKVPDDPCLVLWKAMNQAGKVGNCTDDKLIVKFLREAGYCIAPAPAPEAVKRYAICHETEQICSACPTRSVACEAAKPEAQQAAELAKAHEARRYAQSEVAYLKARLSGARLILMRELKEQGWTPPAPAQAQQAGEPLTNIESPFNACQHREHCKGWKMVATDVVAKAKPEAQQAAEMGPSEILEVADKHWSCKSGVRNFDAVGFAQELLRMRGIGASGEAT